MPHEVHRIGATPMLQIWLLTMPLFEYGLPQLRPAPCSWLTEPTPLAGFLESLLFGQVKITAPRLSSLKQRAAFLRALWLARNDENLHSGKYCHPLLVVQHWHQWAIEWAPMCHQAGRKSSMALDCEAFLLTVIHVGL